MTQYRKKPLVIEAWHIEFDGEQPAWVAEAFVLGAERAGGIAWCPAGDGLRINTLEGSMKASMGDMLIRGVMHELYGCKPDVFAATYEPAALAAAPEQAVPSGWRLVPEVPTDDMLDAATTKEVHTCDQGDPWYSSDPLSEGDARNVWRAMLAATPVPHPPARLEDGQPKSRMILCGPQTHIGWTPDNTPRDQQFNVVLIRETDFNRLAALEDESHVGFLDDVYEQCCAIIKPIVDEQRFPGSVVETLQILVKAELQRQAIEVPPSDGSPQHEACAMAHRYLLSHDWRRDGDFFVEVNHHGAQAMHVSTVALIVGGALEAARTGHVGEDGAQALVAKWRHAAEHLGLEGLASLADCADELEQALALAAPARDEPAPRGFVMVPLRMTQEMRDVIAEEEWNWGDLLAAAGAVTLEEYGLAHTLDEEAMRAAQPSPAPQDAEPAPLGTYQHRCPHVTGHRGPSFVCQRAGHGVDQHSYCKDCPCQPAPQVAVEALSDEQIAFVIVKQGIMSDAWPSQKQFNAFARAILAAAAGGTHEQG